MDGCALVGRRVWARWRVEQSPLDPTPAVPPRTVGDVEDFDALADLYAVDFGDPYGVVLCSRCEIDCGS
jgi:hypothetical protein